MNQNTNNYKDKGETEALVNHGQELSSTSQHQMDSKSKPKKDSGLFPSNLLTKNLVRDDYEKIPTQDFEGIQMRELRTNSSDGIILTPSLIPGQHKMELKEAKKKKIPDFLLLNMKKFLTIYCEATPVASVLRERFAFLLTIFLCSRSILETKRIEEIAAQFFVAFYCCLAYQIIENLLQYRFVIRTTNLRAQKVECLFDLADKILLGFTLFMLDLQHDQRVNGWSMVVPPLLFLLEIQMYRKQCEISQAPESDPKVIWRVFCAFQTAMIAAKVTKLINFKLKETLVFMWSYAGIHALYTPFAVLVLAIVGWTSIKNQDTRTIRLLKNKILGYIWNICWNILNTAALIIIFGFCKKIDSNEDELFKSGLGFAKNWSFFLVIILVLLFPILKKSEFKLLEDLGMTFQSQVARVMVPRKKYTLKPTEDQNKIAFFKMISPTFFSQLRDMTQTQFDELTLKNTLEYPPKDNKEEEEENLCYVCENHVSNAILTECGHGGVCCECAVKLVEQKNECMGCRKPAAAVYKIENNDSTSKSGEVIVQAHELVEIVPM